MGFKNNTVKYYIVKEGYLDKECTILNNKGSHKYELTPGQLLDMTYGILDYKMIKTIIEWLKEEDR